MIVLLWNILLALFWSSITGKFNISNLSFGMLIGYLVLYTARGALGIQWYFLKTKAFIILITTLIIELIKSSLRIAYDILTLTHHMRPGIIKVPLDIKSPVEITLFSNFISLTPGTLSIELSENSEELFVHVLYLPDTSLEQVAEDLKRKYERLIMELLR